MKSEKSRQCDFSAFDGVEGHPNLNGGKLVQLYRPPSLKQDGYHFPSSH